MTEHLGGPESPDKLRERQGRYERLEGGDRMFKIVEAASGAGVGSVGFWTSLDLTYIGSIVYRRLTMNLTRAQAETYADWFRCLADPTRIEILNLLGRERRLLSVGEIVERLEVGQSTVSEHLRRLAETCFVLVEHRGTNSYFRINESCIDSFPSAAEFVMGRVAEDRLPAPRPGATSRRRRAERRSGASPRVRQKRG